MKKLKKYINRKLSIITGKDNLEILYTFKDFPAFIGCVSSSQDEDFIADMEWAIDPDSGIIQLTKLIPLEILYQIQHGDGYGPTWQEYYQALSEKIILQNPRKVMEIGGGQGTLAVLATKKLPQCKWLIVEPNPWVKDNKQIKIIKAFFDENFHCEEKIDTIVFSQVLEHIFDPDAFIRTINKFIPIGGKFIFGYPNLKTMLQKKYTNAINPEHTMFLTDYFVDYLLLKNNFRILSKEFFKEDHSIFYTVKKIGNGVKTPKYKNKYIPYKKIFTDFINYHLQMINNLNKKMDNSKIPIYLFGAHIFAQYLFGFGLKQDKIISILDNSPTKQGQRLYGTQFMVESPKILKGKGPVVVILKAGIYNKEIKKDILENINSKVIFW